MGRFHRIPKLFALAGVIVTWGGAAAVAWFDWHTAEGKVIVVVLAFAGVAFLVGLLLPERLWNALTRQTPSVPIATPVQRGPRPSTGIYVEGDPNTDIDVSRNIISGFEHPIDIREGRNVRVSLNRIWRWLW